VAKSLEGKIAVVTGAGRGIGRSIALLLAQEGARVVVNDPGVNTDGTGHDQGPADQVVAEIKQASGEALSNYDSVASMEGGEGIIKTALDNWGRLDILINNAGILRDRMIFNMTEEEWDAVIAVHLKGHFACTKPAAVVMRQQRYGRIINMSSTSGLVGNPGQANYGAAKAGIAGFTRVVARDLGRYGVTCNAIAPAAATRLTATVPQAARDIRARAGIQSVAGQATAQPAMAQPEHIAPMVAYLCTDQAWNINGQVFQVSGGSISLLYHPTPYRTIYKPDLWSVDELLAMVPQRLMMGITNPAPPPPELDLPGRPGTPAPTG
jgi:NAD(P)-dependent dehydrogenase (short-subunit alcohol dehydrogenase family)